MYLIYSLKRYLFYVFLYLSAARRKWMIDNVYKMNKTNTWILIMFTKTNNNNTSKDCFMLSKDKLDAHIYSRFDMRWLVIEHES